MSKLENGTFEDFLAQVDKDLESGMMSPRVFNDEELHRAELDRIFTRCWVYVGHESEIQSPGDYVLRYVGEDQFILVRDEQGEIQLLLNNCMHRASAVCRADKGNASHFRCPYHGWIYKNSGEWNGAPQRARAYPDIDPKEWGLRKAPHVDSYQGLIFACLDPDAVSLQEYLGDMCWYLDVIFGITENGMSVVGDPHRWVVEANWKSGAENFAGDSYHVTQLHRSTHEIGVFPQMNVAAEGQFQISLENGHGMVGNPGNLPEPWGIMDFPPDVVELFDLSKLDENQRAFLERRLSITVFTIFPNLSFIRVPGVVDPQSMPVAFTLLRQWQPKGTEQMEVWNWPLVWKDASPEFNAMAYHASVSTFSSSGVFEQDDTVAWAGAPFAGRSAFARSSGMKLNYQLGWGGKAEEPFPDFPGPGDALTSHFAELSQRRWWQRWRQEIMAS